MDFFTPQQTAILSSIAKYKYLTVNHFKALKIGSSDRLIRDNLKILRERKLTEKMSFGTIPIKGRFQDLHFLTERGAKMLIESLDLEPEEVKHPSRASTFFKNDYLHRVSTIDLMISFNQWTEKNGYIVDLFDTYFDKVGSQRATETGVQSKTRFDLPNGKNISPDAVVKYEANGKNYLFCLEVYNGKDTKRVIDQIRKLTYATFEGIPSKKYDHNKTNRNLILFEFDDYKNYAIDRIKKDSYLSQFEGLEKVFFFSSIEAQKLDFGANWTDLNAKSQNLSNL
jgi:hypothetical protein